MLLAETDKKRKRTKDPLAVSIGRNIRLFRDALEMKQEEVADAADISFICISRYENGWQVPSVENLIVLARVLRRSVGDLLEEQMFLPSRGDLFVGVA